MASLSPSIYGNLDAAAKAEDLKINALGRCASTQTALLVLKKWIEHGDVDAEQTFVLMTQIYERRQREEVVE